MCVCVCVGCMNLFQKKYISIKAARYTLMLLYIDFYSCLYIYQSNIVYKILSLTLLFFFSLYIYIFFFFRFAQLFYLSIYTPRYNSY